jgi:hypothetical protein
MGKLRTFASFVSVVSFVVTPRPATAQLYESIGIRAQGMSGAFVAVADDATTTWWNPAGLASGGFFNAVLEFDRVEEPASTRARGFALTVPSLGLSYYRLALNGMRPPGPTEMPSASREDQGVLSQFGATVGQSLGAHLVVASTLKLVRALGESSGDLDMGVMAMFGGARVGLAVKNLRTPAFSDGVRQLELSRQARTGFSFKAGSASTAEVTAAVDADLTTTPTAFGDVRHLATGVEALLANRTVGLRGGVGINTLGETRMSGSVGASLAFRGGLFGDVQLTRGDDESRNGWGFAIRLTF